MIPFFDRILISLKKGKKILERLQNIFIKIKIGG